MAYSTKPFAPQLVYDAHQFTELEQQLSELDAEFKVREIEVTFTGERYFFGDVRLSSDAYRFIREMIFKGIEVQEHFVALFLNQSNRIIGYYHHSMGTINSTQVDIELVASVALKTLAKAVIISHNHPSGNLKPSEADRVLTRRLREALKLFDIALLDHIITTREGHYSFADNSESGLNGPDEKPSEMEHKLREEVLHQLRKVTEANSPNLFQMIQSKEGYRAAEEMILRKVLRDQMIPSAVTPQMESEMEMIG